MSNVISLALLFKYHIALFRSRSTYTYTRVLYCVRARGHGKTCYDPYVMYTSYLQGLELSAPSDALYGLH